MELDVRPIPRARKHATIFDTFENLDVGEHFTLVNDHDPVPLRAQFDVDFARSFTWEYAQAGPEVWRIRITKTARTPAPQVLTNTRHLAVSDGKVDLTGAMWKIPVTNRDLDSNLITLPANSEIASHRGPSIDVMMLIVAGDGTLETEVDEVALAEGDLVWLPKHSVREIRSGAGGLRYLTVHTRKTGLQISSI